MLAIYKLSSFTNYRHSLNYTYFSQKRYNYCIFLNTSYCDMKKQQKNVGFSCIFHFWTPPRTPRGPPKGVFEKGSS